MKNGVLVLDLLANINLLDRQANIGLAWVQFHQGQLDEPLQRKVQTKVFKIYILVFVTKYFYILTKFYYFSLKKKKIKICTNTSLSHLTLKKNEKKS